MTHPTSVLITGASRGIGAAAARRFARDGAHVTLVARSADAIAALAQEIEADPSVRTKGGGASAVAADVVDYAAVEAATKSAQAARGRLDMVINNAGAIEPIARLEDSDPKAWARAANANSLGVYHGLRAAIPILRAQGAGTIVSISSGAATNPLEGWSHYCSSKAAALMLTRCAHKEVGDAGVRVLGLSPGTVATAMQVAIKASGVNPVSQLDPSVHIPPEWVAEALAWMFTAEADPWLGRDVSLRAPEVRAAVGLPAP